MIPLNRAKLLINFVLCRTSQDLNEIVQKGLEIGLITKESDMANVGYEYAQLSYDVSKGIFIFNDGEKTITFTEENVLVILNELGRHGWDIYSIKDYMYHMKRIIS